MTRSVSVFSIGAFVLCSAAALSACGPKKSSSSDNSNPNGSLGGASCDPMVPQQCGFPFPSSVYLVADSTTATGRRVTFGAGTLPLLNGTNLSPSAWADSDGFSPGQAPMTFMANASVTGLPTQDYTEATGVKLSVDLANSPTLLLEDDSPSDTTKAPVAVPHFSELDVQGMVGVDQALMIRPIVRLKDNTRYIVAIRNVQDTTGAVIPPSSVFKALLGTGTSSDPTVAARKDLYANIFAKLKTAGVDTSNLQIAWDYYTASTQNNTGQLVSMRDQAIAALPSTGPAYTILGHFDNPDAHTGRRIFGTVSVPLFLDSGTVAPAASEITTGYQLQKDSTGKPKLNGFMDVQFVVNIPASVFTGTASAPTLFQGHGLFSDRSEGQNDNSSDYNYLLRLGDNHQYVTVATDLIGWRTPENYESDNYTADWKTQFPNGDPLTEDDNAKAGTFVLGDAGKFRGMIDRGTQGIINELITVKMMETSLAANPLLAATDGHKFIDTTKSYYRGDSQGGILGVTFMALTQTVSRGYLGEPGIPYNLLLMRSSDFGTFLQALQLNYMSEMNTQMVLALMQMFWDRLEGDGFAPFITSNPLPNTGITHNVIIADALGDYQVTPLGAHILARAVGADAITPELRPLYGVTSAPSASFMGSGILEYDFGVLTAPGVTVPLTDTPPTGNADPHDKIRQLNESESQADTFFKSGNAQSYCMTSAAPSTCVCTSTTALPSMCAAQ